MQQSYMLDLFNSPTVVYFRTNWQNISSAAVWRIEALVNCRIVTCESWKTFSSFLENPVSLVLVDAETFDRYNITPAELAEMTSSPVGVVVDKSSYHIIPNLKNSNMQGVVPAILDVGREQTANAISTLLNGKCHWPKKLNTHTTTEIQYAR